MVFYNLGHIIGEKGEKGDKGDKGNKGDKGDAGTITLDNNVTQGSSNAVKSSGIYSALTGKANTVHTHTKSEITDFSHTHSISDVTDLQTNLNAKVNTSDIANNLTTTASGKVLDARQGKALKDYVDGLVGDIEEDMLQ